MRTRRRFGKVRRYSSFSQNDTITVFEYVLTSFAFFCLIDYKHAPFTQFVQSAYGLTDKVLTAVVYAIGFDGNDYGKELGCRLGLESMEHTVITRVINMFLHSDDSYDNGGPQVCQGLPPVPGP